MRARPAKASGKARKVPEKAATKPAPARRRSKPADCSAPASPEVRGALSAIFAMSAETWTLGELGDHLRENGVDAPAAVLQSTLGELCQAGEVETLGGSYRRASTVLARSPLGLLVARVLGEQHEPITFVALFGQVLRSVSTAESRLTETIDAMVPVYVTRLPDGRLVTAGWKDSTGGTLPPLHPSVAELLAAAPRVDRRIVTILSAEDRAVAEVERATLARAADKAAAEAKAAAQRVKACSKILRTGQRVRRAPVATVPDYERRLMVTFDCGGDVPVVLREVPLPRHYGMGAAEQGTLPFAAAKGVSK